MTSVLTSAMIPWAKIKIQIDKFEKSPDSLSREQLLALSYLAPFMEEPELADSDYVSELMHLVQGQRLPLPTFRDLDAIEIPVNGAFHLAWQCICTLPWSGEQFPAPDPDSNAKRPALFFAKKKAKQYAAREALTHLKTLKSATQASASISSSKESPVKPTAAMSRSVPVVDTAASSLPQTRDSPNSATPPPSESKRQRVASPHSGNLPNNLDTNDLSQQIKTLCRRLGYATPTYTIAESTDNPRFFKAFATFNSRDQPPASIVNIDNVLGKREAKAEIELKLLRWLGKEEATRQSKIDALFA